MYFTWSQDTDKTYIFSIWLPNPRGLKASNDSCDPPITATHNMGDQLQRWFPNSIDRYKHLLFYNTASIRLFFTSTFPIHTLYIYIYSQSFFDHTHMCELSSYTCSILCTYMHTQHLLSLLYIIHYAELLFYACTSDMPLFSRPVNILAPSLLCYNI